MKLKTKVIFISFVITGYFIAIILSYPKLNTQFINKQFCTEFVGPVTCQPDEDCDRECTKFETKLVSRGGETFYTYGLLGAFMGGWAGVLFITYILKE